MSKHEVSSIHKNKIFISSPKGPRFQISYEGKTLSAIQTAKLIDTISSFSLENKLLKYTLAVPATKNSFQTIQIDIECSTEKDAIFFYKHREKFTEKLLFEIENTASATETNISPYFDVLAEKAWNNVKKLFSRISQTFKDFPLFEILEEAARIFLATNSEFKKIRPTKFLARLIISQFTLRNSWHSIQDPAQVRIKTRIWNSKLLFPFGSQRVISLAISLHSLSSNEKFDLPHIFQACQRLLPCVKEVPNSYYFYRHAKDHSWNFYIELNKELGGNFTLLEIKKLKVLLRDELASSIEQVAHKIDIPYNEEEILRTIKSLSLELKTQHALPHVIVHFQKQKPTSIQFNVYVLRLIEEDKLTPIKAHPRPSLEGTVTLKLHRQEIIGRIRKKYVKVLQLFEASCEKINVLRPDSSINFLKAREYVLDAVTTFFGPVRDVNGGFLSDQRAFLSEIKHYFGSIINDKEEQLIEQLVRTLKPNVGRILPEKQTVLKLCSLLFAYHREQKNNASSMRYEECNDGLHIVLKRPSQMAEEELLQVFELFSLQEHEMMHTFLLHEGYIYGTFVFLTSSLEIRKKIVSWFKSVLHNYAQRVKRQQGIRISLPRPTRMLDPRIGTDRTSGTVIKMLYEGLLRLDLDGKPTYALAKSYTVSNDGQQYVFKLRNSFWSNGERVVADDFEYAWKKILDPSFQTVYSYLFLPIKNAKAVKDSLKPISELGVKALDSHTLLIDLEKPYPYFLELITHWIYSPLCHTTDLTHPGWAFFGAEHHVCNGPFRLSKWQCDNEIEAVKNENYWNEEDVSIERIHMRIIENPKTAWKLFQKGELDWIGEPLSLLPQSLMKSPPVNINYHNTNGVQWFALNTKKTFFANKKIRHAFSLGVDRETIVNTCRFGKERICHSLLSEKLSMCDPQSQLPYDPKKAVRLFREALEEMGQNSSQISLKMIVYDSESLVFITKQVAQMWEKLFGIHIDVEVLEWHQFFDTIPHFSYDIVSIIWYSWFNHALYTFETLTNKNKTMNLCQWNHPDFQKLVEQIISSRTNEERQRYTKAAESLLIDEMPIIPVFEYLSQYAKNKALENMYISPVGNIDFRWAQIKTDTS